MKIIIKVIIACLAISSCGRYDKQLHITDPKYKLQKWDEFKSKEDDQL